MASPATTAARARIAVVCAIALAVLAIAFGVRTLSAVRSVANDPRALDSTLWDSMVLLVIGAFVCGLAIALTASSLAIAPLSSLTHYARAMRRDLGLRTRMHGEDEVGQLGRALDELAAWVANEKTSLEDDRNRLVAILESMAEGVLVTGKQGPHEGVVVLANAALRSMLLLDRAILGRPPIEAIRVAGLDEILERGAESPDGASGELELGGIRPRRLLVRAAPIKRDGEVEGIVAVFNDVTDLRRLENVRRDFVANVSHELRTPITAITSATETLQNGAIDDPATAREFVAIVGRHAVRLQRLVEDLLELSRIEAREWRLQMEPVDASEVAKAALEVVGERGARVTRSIEPKVMVSADRRALEQVLTNLLDNAVKYAGQGASIDVSARREGEHVELVVRDTGAGIEPRHLPRIFERFYRVDAGRSRAVGGTGLGLSIVKHLVEAMHGSVEVESKVGEGTTFRVRLRATES